MSHILAYQIIFKLLFFTKSTAVFDSSPCMHAGILISKGGVCRFRSADDVTSTMDDSGDAFEEALKQLENRPSTESKYNNHFFLP